MFVLFSSDAETLFKRGILDVLALPADHPITFRYQSKYVAPSIQDSLHSEGASSLLRKAGTRVLIIYAQKPRAHFSTYQYCPVRFARISSIRLLGDIFLIDVALQECANL